MYWKIPLNVPKGIKYLGNWPEFKLSRFQGHNILHKQLPGCGFTEYALTCPFPVVLCSPRKMLMENKKEQHGDSVFLVRSKFDRDMEIDDDISKTKSTPKNYVDSDKIYLDMIRDEKETIYSTLFREISEYLTSIYQESKFPKIIVTYDSSGIVKEILESMGLLQDFWFIVDEFQSLMEDARFKADTENNFLTSVLPSIPNVLHVSATPLMDKYIQRIPELNLPYYEMDWGALDPTRIKRPDLKVRTMKSVASKMEEIIQTYLEGNFEKVIVNRGYGFQEIESKEAVLYVNSVNHIINIIKKMGLTPDQVNILCSDTPENQRRIDKKLGKRNRYKIGSVPLRGESHKMFTFCTRTVYLGADFYSTNARSFIFSDSNADCLSVDISMDLAQILGRQRLESNPWNNSAEFYYKTTCDYKKMTREDLQKIIDSKIQKTNNILEAFSCAPSHTHKDVAEKYQRSAKADKYKFDYVSVNHEKDNLIPVINNLVILSEERSFEIQQVDYKDRFSVFCKLEEEFSLGLSNTDDDIVSKFFKVYDKTETYLEKVRMVCEFILDNSNLRESIVENLSDHDKIKQQLIILGPEKIKSTGYNITLINKAMGITIFDRSTLDSVVFSEFILGQRYTKKYIKEKLGEIYRAADFHGSAKASDLENWFEIKEVRMSMDENGKREPGFEIIKRK